MAGHDGHPSPIDGAAGAAAGVGGTTQGSGGASAPLDAGAAGEVMTPGGAGTTSGADPCPVGFRPTSQLVRLTGDQYDKTVSDLLGVTTLSGPNSGAPSTMLAFDSSGDMSDRDWAAYQAVAATVASQVMTDPALSRRFIDCAPDVVPSACLHDTIVAFGRRAFRRPLTDAEVKRFEDIGARGSEITEHGTLSEVAQVILEAFLVSPSFLQRVESSETPDGNGNFVLSSYELAARLSYLFWGSMPDETLALAADAGELTTPEQIAEQANRLVADPRVRDLVRAFHRYYVGMGADSYWDQIDKSPEHFPDFTSETASLAIEETERFFERLVVDDGGTFQDFFTSPLAFVNATTAPLYGLDPRGFGADLESVTLDASARPGFLTRVAFLSAYAYPERTSPQLRGAFIVRNVLGFDTGVHPFGLETPVPTPAPDLDTVRKLVAAQDAGPTCIACHGYIDQPGFVLEAFDAVGAHQSVEAQTGAPIDTTADVTIDENPLHVSSPAELMQALSGSYGARRRYAERWVSFAYGRDNHPDDACMVEQFAGRMTATRYPVLQMLAELPLTKPFRLRAVEVP